MPATHLNHQYRYHSRSPNNNYVLAYQQTTPHEEQPITWLVENFTPALHQSALIKQRKLKDRLILDLWYQQAGKKIISSTLPT